MKKKRTYQILIPTVLMIAVIGILFINKKIKIAPLLAGRFEVTGVDVSHYQGTIDWEKLAGQNLDFAFIKATEGSSYVDVCFYDNWQNAEKTDLYIGAYHFFSFDSGGKEQAQLYIDTVGDLNGKMAPVVDVEFYGDKKSNPPQREEVVKQLGIMLETLEECYQVKPVIYTTYAVYNNYIKNEFEEYPLWIRNVYYQPLFIAGNEWTFWQYTDTAVLDGYEGTEKYIDMDVFRGTQEELEKLIVHCEPVSGNCKEDASRDEVFAAIDEGDSSVAVSEHSDQDETAEDAETPGLIVTDNRGAASEVGYTDIESFLKDFKFDDKEPFYQYNDENGNLQLELYYDETEGRGCGIRYYPGKEQEPEGFLFNGSKKYLYHSNFDILQERMNADPYVTLPLEGIDLSKDNLIEDYEENIEYTSDGRLERFKSQGWITYIDEEREIQRLLEIKFTYREDGTLQQRDYVHNTFVLGTWYSVVHSFYDRQERLLYEDCYITHGSMDYYYIYQGEETTPSYCLVLDHNTGYLCAELMSIHDIVQDEDGKQYGIVGPDLSDNFFVRAVREAGNYDADEISHTYEYNYDGDGYYEAFVIIGDCKDMWGEVTEDQISGDVWFADHDKNVTYLGTHSFRAWQEYITQDGKTYIFLHHDVGLPWETDIYTVQDGEPVICAGKPEYRTKYLNESGQVIEIQSAYDGSFDTQSEYGWSGHTWKPYTFEFDHGELKEIGAREVTLEDVIKIAPLPDSFDEKEYDGLQYILRDNGELNINVASYIAEYAYINFDYFTYCVNENGEWELVDEDSGFYQIQLNGESHWDYLDTLEEFSSDEE